MSEESKDENWLVKVLAEANLPQLILGPAGKAIAQLVAGVTDIPTAWLAGKADEIRSNAEARRSLKLALVEAAGPMAVADADLMARAVQTYLPEQMRKQSNREGVARATLDHLTEAGSEAAIGSEVDPDWMNVFVRYSEDASSDRLQDLWGRVLAGEIRSSGQTSLSTLRFIAELDSSIAAKFENFAQNIIQSNYVRKPDRLEGQEFLDLRILEEIGLISGIQGNFDQKIIFDEFGYYNAWSKSYFLRMCAAPNFEFRLRAILLTRVGREVYRIVSQSSELETLSDFAMQSRVPAITSANIYDRAITDGRHSRVKALWDDDNG